MRLLSVVFLLAVKSAVLAQSVSVIPQPAAVETRPGDGMALPADFVVAAPEMWQPHLDIFAEHLHRITRGRCRMQVGNADAASLVVQQAESLAAEEYTLDISARSIDLQASSLKGLAHGTATLLQLIGNARTGILPRVRIADQPKAAWRSLMIDMGRNPHSIELLRETIDLLWFYKVDSLHLHLTDDQRFAWPSSAYPKLWDGKITLDQFRGLEAYAVNRGVTIIPELEVPGHSAKLTQIYPETFGKNATELATSETALLGIKTLLDEMTDVFRSSPYIHIGGDEAFGVPVDAQRNLINRLNAYLKSKGRQTVVWEGPPAGKGDNKVHTDVIHINWRTIAYRPDQMLSDGYRVINAAWDPLYVVDHYPRINFTMTSPQHIYETLRLTRFKHVNPGIPTFAKPIDVAPTDRLMGFSMPWWEGREENFFAQVVPRIIPFAAVAWNPDTNRDYADFAGRVATAEVSRRAAFYPISIRAEDLAVPADGVFHNQTSVTLNTTVPDSDGEVRYTLDGTTPTSTALRYEKPFTLKRTSIVRAALFADGRQVGHGSRLRLTAVQPVENLALGKPATSSASSGQPFSVERLTDGGTDNLDFYLGYPAEPAPIHLTVDLGGIQQVSRIAVHAYSINNSFEQYTVEVSADGQNFEQIGAQTQRPAETVRPKPRSAAVVEYNFDVRGVRFIRIVTNGNKGYVFDSFSKLVEIQAFGEAVDVSDVEPDVLQPVITDYSRFAFYPDRWKRAGADFEMLAWEGEHVVFLTKQGNYDSAELTAFVKRLDGGWQTYSELIGQQPRRHKTINGKPVICAIPKTNLSCGYGCGFVGATGIEASAFYRLDLPTFRRQPKSFQHYYFYEMGRNFFVFGDRHSLFVTGYADFMRYVCMDRLKCTDPDAKTRATIERCEAVYANSDIGFYEAFTNLGAGEKSNRLREANGAVINPSDQPVMYATAMLKLRRDYGGDEWVKKFYHALLQCDPAQARNIDSAATQIFNWLVCASFAAEQDLTPIFADRWRLPISQNQRRTLEAVDWSEQNLNLPKLVAALVSDQP